MGWIILFILSTLLILGFLALAFNVSKESDETYGNTNFSKNQIRVLGWVVGIIICIIAAVIEFYIVIKDDPEESSRAIPAEIIRSEVA